MYIQDVFVCTFKTPCTHGDVLNAHREAFLKQNTFFHVFSACRNSHTPNTKHTISHQHNGRCKIKKEEIR